MAKRSQQQTFDANTAEQFGEALETGLTGYTYLADEPLGG